MMLSWWDNPIQSYLKKIFVKKNSLKEAYYDSINGVSKVFAKMKDLEL